MNMIELNNEIKNKEVNLEQFNFSFIPDFIPSKAIVTSFSLKEGFPGDVYLDIAVKGHIKGFPEYEVTAYRKKRISSDFNVKFDILEFNNLEDVFPYETLLDLEEEGIVDIEKNIIFLNQIKYIDENLEKKLKELSDEEKIKYFLKTTEKLIEQKIIQKVLKFLESLKEPQTPNYPDEIKDFVSPKGILIEPRQNNKVKSISKKPPLDLKIRGLSKIPSVNSVLKKIKTGKKLNYVETLINEKLNEYMSGSKNSISKKDILETVFKRETIRKVLIDENIQNLDLKTNIRLFDKEFETKIKILNNTESQEPEIPF